MSCHVKVSILRALRAKLAFSYVVHEGPQMGLWGAFTFDFLFLFARYINYEKIEVVWVRVDILLI